MTKDILEKIQQLLDSGIGDAGRLTHIQDFIQNGKKLYLSDQDYLDKIISENFSSLSENYDSSNRIDDVNNDGDDTKKDNDTVTFAESDAANDQAEEKTDDDDKDTVAVDDGDNTKQNSSSTAEDNDDDDKTPSKINHKQKLRSPLWYELPLIFSIFGGIIAYFIIRQDDPKKARNCIIIGVVFLVPLIASLILFAAVGTSTVFVVASGSMEPELKVHDVATINARVPFEEIQVGDIIVFNRPSDHAKTIIHRVVAITNDNPKTITTKGDANVASIPGTDFPITKKEYLGKVDRIIPQFGNITKFTQPPVRDIIFLSEIAILVIPVIMHLRFSRSAANTSNNND